MITPAYVRTMAAYNAEMNRRIYAAAARLPDTGRRADRGAFFGSIHGTLNHLLWADRMWMARFAGWEQPAVNLAGSPGLIDAFEALHPARVEADAALLVWAERVEPAWLDGTTSWFSGAAGQDMTRPTAKLVMHLFNHQTHHRGQVHAMLTAARERTGETDLWFVV